MSYRHGKSLLWDDQKTSVLFTPNCCSLLTVRLWYDQKNLFVVGFFFFFVNCVKFFCCSNKTVMSASWRWCCITFCIFLIHNPWHSFTYVHGGSGWALNDLCLCCQTNKLEAYFMHCSYCVCGWVYFFWHEWWIRCASMSNTWVDLNGYERKVAEQELWPSQLSGGRIRNFIQRYLSHPHDYKMFYVGNSMLLFSYGMGSPYLGLWFRLGPVVLWISLGSVS